MTQKRITHVLCTCWSQATNISQNFQAARSKRERRWHGFLLLRPMGISPKALRKMQRDSELERNKFMFHILTVVWLHVTASVKTHRIMHLRFVHFTANFTSKKKRTITWLMICLLKGLRMKWPDALSLLWKYIQKVSWIAGWREEKRGGRVIKQG